MDGALVGCEVKNNSELKGETSGANEETKVAKLEMRDESHGRHNTPRSIFESVEITGASLRVGAEISSAEIALALTSPFTIVRTNTTR